VLASAPLNRSLSASFMRLPANCAHPERRASDIRLAIRRVCQAAAAETTVLTEQTEFTDRRQAAPMIAEQIFCVRISQHSAASIKVLEAAALCRAAKDRRPGRATGVTRLRAGLCLHVRAWREILIGKVVVVASVHVPIAHDMATGGHFLPWAPAGRILTAARRVGLSNSCGQSQACEPEAAAYRHRRCASCD
jgi:hypothetical protein